MADPDARNDDLPDPVQRVEEALAAAGHPVDVRLLDSRAHTVDEAAKALGVEAAQIVKSMVLRGKREDRLIVALLPGDRRVDFAKVAAELCEPVETADPAWVYARTGFRVGGIPPLGHSTAATILVDRSLPDQADLWAGAGTSRAMFRTHARQLQPAVVGLVADISGEPARSRR